jgi:hypothetical protein
VTFLSSLLTWANVPFVIAFGVAVMFVALQLSGLLGLLAGGGDHEGDADHEVDHVVDGHDADHEAGGDHEGDADNDADHDADNDADQDADQDADEQQQHQAGGGRGGLLAGMGVGTMPLSIVWQSFAVCFGLGGITVNTIYFTRIGALPSSALFWSLPGALVFAYAATSLVSKVFKKLAPSTGKTSTSRRDLLGKTGVVISSKVSAEFGEVRLTDATGSVLRMICRAMPGEEPIPEGREVVFVDYDRDRDVLFVAPFDIDAPRKRPRLRVSAEAKAGEAPSPEPPEESAEPAQDRAKAP